MTGEDFIIDQGLTGNLLSSSANVFVSGKIEVKKEYTKNREECFRCRNINTKWIWFDDVDANSFPGIATLKSESKNVYQNVEMDFLGIFSATLEGYVDYMEPFTRTDFKVKIYWENKNTSVGDSFIKE
ncbi:MAG: hypothetical protein A2017_09940 [Lentisphaerae bacterium GWF2_44_16]|nr:MAG: hypothetical protein A2017_09940 [Lentisphaerae bacterium GWF2_44_16]